jgi:hypothetical protein
MPATHSASQSASGTARQAARSRPLELLTRFGFIAYGVMHALLGWLALQIAWGGTRREGDQSGAFQFLASKPLGKVLLILVVIGLAAMTIWQVLSAAVGHTDEQGRRRLAERVFSGARAVVYAVLAWTAIRVVAGSGHSSAQKQQNATSSLLSSTGGRWLVALIGVAVLGFGVGMAIYGVMAAFERKLETGRMNEGTRHTAKLLGRIGYLAKGVAFAIVGILLLIAAVRKEPNRSRGLDAALRTLAAQPYGGWLLTIVALGFVAFAVFCLFQARYRKV